MGWGKSVFETKASVALTFRSGKFWEYRKDRMMRWEIREIEGIRNKRNLGCGKSVFETASSVALTFRSGR